MFRRHYKKRSTFLPFVIFRLFLSFTIFIILILGIYSAIKYFSGLDPLKLEPRLVVVNLLSQFKEIQKPSFLNQTKQSLGVQLNQIVPQPPTPQKTIKPKLAFQFMLVADSHNDNQNLKKALRQAQDEDLKFVIGLGDYTDVGTVDELQKAKLELDGSGLRYFLTAGDHDLWDSRNRGDLPTANFIKIFGTPFQSFSYSDVRFLIIYNSDNYQGLGEQQFTWLKEEKARIKQENPQLVLAFAHEPLYHPSSERIMGKVSDNLKKQAKDLTVMLKEAGIKEIFAGDVHYFTRYSEPTSGMLMSTVGALTSVRNTQAPRFGKVSVFEDGSYQIEDMEVK